MSNDSSPSDNPWLFDYRSRLMEVVSVLLEAGPEASRRAQVIIMSCPEIKPFTLGDIVWGVLMSLVEDIVFQENTASLKRVRRFLAGDSLEMGRGMVSYNFLPFMDPVERAFYDQLVGMVAFLEETSPEAKDGTIPEARKEVSADGADAYKRREEALRETLARFSPFGNALEETVYRLVLREINAMLVDMDSKLAAMSGTRLAWGFPSVQIYEPRNSFDVPDASGAVAWAKRALAALVKKDVIWMTWELRGELLRFSLH